RRLRPPRCCPCQPWCWTQHGQGRRCHDIELRVRARSSTARTSISSRASLYNGRHVDGEAVFATLESYLQSNGTGATELVVALCRYEYPGSEQVYDHQRLKLTLAYARDLVTVMDHLIALGELAEALSPD
ncbi:MAG TPA: hypothetical protein VER55_12725, partial [Ardenticatenaceae bacterium]|nr:hypothetical protein [Ardenticatenaceae bacterium]